MCVFGLDSTYCFLKHQSSKFLCAKGFSQQTDTLWHLQAKQLKIEITLMLDSIDEITWLVYMLMWMQFWFNGTGR